MVMNLESKLLKESWITPNQFIKAREEQKKTGKSLYSNIIKLGFLTEEDIFRFFAQSAKLLYVRISDYRIKEDLFGLFPEQFYREHLFLPLFKIEDTLYVGMANPLNTDLINTLGLQTNFDVTPLFSCPSAILKVINQVFGPDDKYFDLEDLIITLGTIQNLALWRESERLRINLAIELKPRDERINLVSSAYIPATVCDVSSNGKAMGIRTFIFIPSQIKLLVKFPSKDPSYEAEAEVVHCDMEKKGKYFFGIKFEEIKPALAESIVAEATQPPPSGDKTGP